MRVENEKPKETMKFIESKRNWDVASQCYRKPEAENCKANIADCKIYWRGEYLIMHIITTKNLVELFLLFNS